MTVKASDMVRAVRVAIDMNRGDEPLFTEGDSDTLSLDEIILAKLADAVRLVETEAPHFLLESGHDLLSDTGTFSENQPSEPIFGNEEEGWRRGTTEGVFWTEHGKGFIILPNDFLRLISFRMSDWSRTVYDAISGEDPEYAKQSSRFRGICGNPERPVVAIVRRSEGKVLEFYSCRDERAHVAQATYLPMPRIDLDGGIDVAEDCYRAAVYRAASLALASVGDALSTTMLEISKSLIGG